MKRLYIMRPCCTDELFGEPVMQAFPTESSWHPEYWQVFAQKVRQMLPIANMPLEHKLKQIK